eukprot:2683280-Prymnesium_polylepis.2
MPGRRASARRFSTTGPSGEGPAVDRQVEPLPPEDPVAIEERFTTQSFPFRLTTTVIAGMSIA